MSYSHKGVFKKPYATLGVHKEAKHCVPNKAVFIPWIDLSKGRDVGPSSGLG